MRCPVDRERREVREHRELMDMVIEDTEGWPALDAEVALRSIDVFIPAVSLTAHRQRRCTCA